MEMKRSFFLAGTTAARSAGRAGEQLLDRLESLVDCDVGKRYSDLLSSRPKMNEINHHSVFGE